MQDILKRKLRWRSTRRALLEIDIYLGDFIDQGGLESLYEVELLAYQSLLEFSDNNILLLLQGKLEARDAVMQEVINKINACSKFKVNIN